MPKLAPQAGPITEEVTEGVDEALKSARKFLDAAATAKLMQGVTTVAAGNGSSAVKDVGEVMSAVASSMKSAGELQSSLIQQMAELAQKGMGSDDAELKAMMNRVMMLKMLESLSGGQQRQGIPPELKEVVDMLREENRRLREEIDRLKEDRSDPISSQILSLTTQLLSQNMSQLTNPLQGLRELMKLREEMRDLLGHNGTPPEYSEGALRLKALEKDLKALDIEENLKLREMEQKERMISQQIPALINQAGTVLAGVLRNFGLAPVSLQFDREAQAEAERMAGEG